MTITPSSSLHVETPTLADVKASATYPPTPVTTHSQHSATSSRFDLPAPPPLPEAPTPTKSPTHQEESSASATSAPVSESITISNDDEANTSAALSSLSPSMPAGPVDQGRVLHEGAQSSTGKKGNEGLTVRIDVALPGVPLDHVHVLPPSPPLTLTDARDEPEAAATLSLPPAPAAAAAPSLSASVAPSVMREEDITNWRVSMDKSEEDREQEEGKKEKGELELEEDDEVGEMNGEYDPYDLGYSPETPVGPSAVQTRTPATSAGAFSVQRKDALDHPLRSTVNPPTPPLWETIDPPESMEGALAAGSAGYARPSTNGRSKPLYVLPLLYLVCCV